MMVATAAPRMPSAGNPRWPNISTGSRMALRTVDSAYSQASVLLSPCELKPKMTAKNRKLSTEPAASSVK